MTATDFVMPKLGLTMTEGTVARWGVEPGNRFEAGDIIVVVETDKIAYDVEAPAPGILHAVLVSEGNAVPVGTPIGRWEVGDVEVSLDAPAVIELAVEERAAPPSIGWQESRIPANDAARRRPRTCPGNALCSAAGPGSHHRCPHHRRQWPARTDQGGGRQSGNRSARLARRGTSARSRRLAAADRRDYRWRGGRRHATSHAQ